jgi:integrase
MARPQNENGIRARIRSRDGVQLIRFCEQPDRWIVSPERTREKAIAWAKRNRDRLIARNNKKIAELCEGFYALNGMWVNRHKEKGHIYGDMHLKNRQAYLDNYFAKEFGHLKPQDIDRPEWRREFDNWLLTLHSTFNESRKLSRSTKNKIIYSVNDFIEEMIELKKMNINPLIGLKKYNKDPENPRGVIDRHSLSLMFPTNHNDLIRIWSSPMWACFMLVFYDTGARPGESRALTWADIDTQKRFIPFRKGIEAGTIDTVKGTKTNVAKAGFLHARTIQELDIWRNQSRYNGDNDFVFSANGKTPVTNEAVGKAFRRGLQQIEKENEGWKANPAWTPYWLRHSFGTYQMENLDDTEIAKLMGNGVVVLRKEYQHPDNETLFLSTKKIRTKLDKSRKSG